MKVFAITLTMLLCTDIFASEGASHVSPTQNLIAYFDSLLEIHTISDADINDIIDSIEAGSLTCPISPLEAQRTAAKGIARDAIISTLEQESIEQTEILNWAHQALIKLGQEDKRREATRKKTKSLLDLNHKQILSAGFDHTCALILDGNLKCWGNDEKGLISIKPSNLGPALAVSAGHTHTCAVNTNNQGICWGIRIDGGTRFGVSHEQIDLGPAASISLSKHDIYVIRPDGGLYSRYENVGLNLFLPLSTLFPAFHDWLSLPPTELSAPGSVSVIAAGYYNACVQTARKSLECWGYPSKPDNLGPVLDISAGEKHVCAVKIDGNLECWGGDDFGQVSAKPKDLGPVLTVSAGGYHTCVVKLDGEVECWGDDRYGQTKSGKPDDLGPVLALSAGGYHTCAAKLSGRVVCWGRNSHKQASPPDGLTIMFEGSAK